MPALEPEQVVARPFMPVFTRPSPKVEETKGQAVAILWRIGANMCQITRKDEYNDAGGLPCFMPG